MADGVVPPSVATQLYLLFLEEWSTAPQGYSGPNPWSLTLLNAPWALINTTAVDPSRCKVLGNAFYTNLQLSRSANNRYLTFGCADPSDVTDKRRTVVRVNWNTTLAATAGAATAQRRRRGRRRGRRRAAPPPLPPPAALAHPFPLGTRVLARFKGGKKAFRGTVAGVRLAKGAPPAAPGASVFYAVAYDWCP